MDVPVGAKFGAVLAVVQEWNYPPAHQQHRYDTDRINADRPPGKLPRRHEMHAVLQSEGYEQHEQHQQGIEMGEGCQNAQDDGTYREFLLTSRLKDLPESRDVEHKCPGVP